MKTHISCPQCSRAIAIFLPEDAIRFGCPHCLAVVGIAGRESRPVCVGRLPAEAKKSNLHELHGSACAAPTISAKASVKANASAKAGSLWRHVVEAAQRFSAPRGKGIAIAVCAAGILLGAAICGFLQPSSIANHAGQFNDPHARQATREAAFHESLPGNERAGASAVPVNRAVHDERRAAREAALNKGLPDDERLGASVVPPNRPVHDEQPIHRWPHPESHHELPRPHNPAGLLRKLAEESWSNPYEGYEWRPAIDIVNAEKLQHFRDGRARSMYARSMAFDFEGGYVYWTSGGARPDSSQVHRCKLDGSGYELLVDGSYMPLTSPQSVTLDLEGQKLYWGANEWSKGPRILRCNLDGSEMEVFAILPEGSRPHAAFDPQERELYWTTKDKLLKVKVEPAGDVTLREEDKLTPRIVTALAEEVCDKFDLEASAHHALYPARITIESEKRRLFLAGGSGNSWSWQFDMTDNSHRLIYSQCLHGFPGAMRVLVDDNYQKLIWITPFGVTRSNFDGSQRERLVISDYPRSFVDIFMDWDKNELYWIAGYKSTINIQRAPLPPPYPLREYPAPPQIIGFSPLRAAEGEEIRITGSGFADTKAVTFIDNSTGENVNAATVQVISDSELAVLVPKLRHTCTRAVLTVETPGGVTFTLPNDPNVVHRGEIAYKGLLKHKEQRIVRNSNDDPFVFVLEQGRSMDLERGVMLILPGTTLRPGRRGNNVLFVKDEGSATTGPSENNIVYHEPFAIQTDTTGQNTYIPVPAIRTSLVERLFEHQGKPTETPETTEATEATETIEATEATEIMGSPETTKTTDGIYE